MNTAGGEVCAGGRECGGSTVMFINRGREDEMASSLF